TSQKSACPRPDEPENRTSSGFSARSSPGLSEPVAQRIESETFDLPDPFGPTTTATPGSRRISTGSTNDLNPPSLIALRGTPGGYRGARTPPPILPTQPSPPGPPGPPTARRPSSTARRRFRRPGRR